MSAISYRHKEAYNKIKVGDSSIMRANYSPSLFNIKGAGK
jgi:hypothetical protein